MGRWIFSIVAALAIGTATAQTPAEFTRLELEWSRAALPSIERQTSLSDLDPDAVRYVNQLGNRLAALAPLGWPLPYRFILYDDETGLDIPYFGHLGRVPGVATLPGGVVLVPLGLFRASAEESEFAAGLARGIAHVSLRHVLRAANADHRMFRPIPPADPRLRRLEDLPFLKSWIFPRRLEREADYATAALLARAGFDPGALARSASNKLASFDTSPRRTAWVDQAVRMQPERLYTRGSSTDFHLLKKRLGETRTPV